MYFGARYAESSQKLSYLIEPLTEAFPDARFIWLVRNALDVVASFSRMHLYRDDWLEGQPGLTEWGENRIRGDEVDRMTGHQWSRLPAFAKHCWCWAWTNAKIERDLKKAGVSFIMVRIEDIDHSVSRIAQFLEVTPPANLVLRRWNRSTGTVTKASYWDSTQRRAFRRFCGPLMNRLYPGWSQSISLSLGQRIRNEALSFVSYRRPTGRVLRIGARVLPISLRRRLTDRLKGRGVLNYE